jgi:hypothetical protein
MKKIAILQSSYIPWKGYFDMIAAVDEFILFDDMQYTKRDWRNRNQIKTPQGVLWLTVPVASAHWKALAQNYRRAASFAEIAEWIEPLYLDAGYTHLHQLNRRLIEAICGWLGIKTTITNSWDYPAFEGKSERLAGLCAAAGGAEYVSGPSARNYIDEKVFAERGIKLTWFDYSGYPEYPQLWGRFEHGVTVLDLLFNCGKDAPRYMRYVKP